VPILDFGLRRGQINILSFALLPHIGERKK